MSKRIVTHVNPDLDAITAIWLLTRFAGGSFKDASITFVPAGERLEGEESNTIHVDTGLGKFDHHQPERGKEDTCAAMLVYEWLISEGRIQENEALKRLVIVINDVDHFREFFWPEPLKDRYELFLEYVLNGVKLGGHVDSDEELVRFGMQCLDGVYTSLKIRLKAEEDLEKGISFETRWGKALALESSNSGSIKFALKRGFKVVARRDPTNGMVRIKSAPLPQIDLIAVYQKLVKKDREATWFYHPSGHMVLNGSIRNPKMRPSKLGLDEVIKILKKA